MTSFEAFGLPGLFIRHRNFKADLTTIQEAGPEQDFWFTIEARSGGPGQMAFRSVNFPRACLRHSDFRVILNESSPADKLWGADSTFVRVHGLADRSAVSYRSLNYPDRYLRHRHYELYVEPLDGDQARREATFREVPDRRRPGKFDDGTELVPVDE